MENEQKDRLTYLLDRVRESTATAGEYSELLALVNAEDPPEFIGVIEQYYQPQEEGPLAAGQGLKIESQDPEWRKMVGDIVSIDRVEVPDHRAGMIVRFLPRIAVAA